MLGSRLGGTRKACINFSPRFVGLPSCTALLVASAWRRSNQTIASSIGSPCRREGSVLRCHA
eukprot:8107436-Prorocentrum_lima.AAC.1